MAGQKVTTREVKTILIELDDAVIDQIRDAHQVEVQFISRAMNRTPAPIRLSYATIERLTKDR